MFSSPLAAIINEYQSIEASCNIDLIFDNVTYDAPVNFNESLHTPRHRWFPYKEGFSPSFVRSFISRYAPKSQSIFDPFSGVGTTPIEGAINGIDGRGIEISPLSHFVSIAKTTELSDVELEDFEEITKRFAMDNLRYVSDMPSHQTVISYFKPENLDALLRIKAFYQNIENEKYRMLFKLAFLSVIERFSTHRKAGNGLKRKTRIDDQLTLLPPLENVRTAITSVLSIIMKDIQLTPIKGKTELILGSSLEDSQYQAHETFDCVLTSPPYANCFDYSKIYLCELWLGDFFVKPEDQKEFRKKSVRSHVHSRWDNRHEELGSDIVNNQIAPYLKTKQLWSSQIPSMLVGYFMDMGKLLSNLKAVVSSDAPIGIVVSNSMYGGIPIATDLLISEIARKIGFFTEKIEVYRRIIPASQQYVLLNDKNYLRESLVVIRKIRE